MTQQTRTVLTPEVMADDRGGGGGSGVLGCGRQGVPQAIYPGGNGPDPRYWDEEFASATTYGEIIAPPIMVSLYIGQAATLGGGPGDQSFQREPSI